VSDYREDVDALESAKDEADQGDPKTVNNQRQMNARQLIARKAEFNMQKDAQEHGATVEIDDGVPDEDMEGGVSPAFMVTDDTLKKALESQPAQKTEPEKAKQYQIKVNGQELTMNEQELIDRAQKVEAADRYLSEKKREADLLLAEARLKSQQPSEQYSAVAQDEVSEEDLELVRALQVGDEHTAAKALKARISALKQAQPAIPMDAIVAKVKDDMDFQSAAKWFKTEYKDIFSDPKLTLLANQLDEQYRTMDLANKTITPYMDRYRNIGEEIRQWKGASPDFAEKKKQKQETVRSIPQASVRNVPLNTEEDEERSYSDIIAEMAKRRGQQHIGG